MNGQHRHLEDLEVVEFALDGMEGSARAEAEEHLKVCPHCRAMLAETMLLHDGFAELGNAAPAPGGLVESILAKARETGR